MRGRVRVADLAVVVAFAAARLAVLWIYLALPYRWKGLAWGDLSLYSRWSTDIIETAATPTTSTWMYPPGAIPVILLPDLLPLRYHAGFAAVLVVVDLGVLALLLGPGRHRAGAWTWALLPPVLGVISWARLDLVPVAATAAALLWARHRPRLAGVLAAVGAAVKIWPALLAAVHLDNRRWLIWALGSGAAMVVLATLALDGTWEFAARLAGRNIQVESVLATPWLVVQAAGWPPAGDYGNGTYEILAPGSAWVSAAAAPLLLGAVALAWWASRGWDPAVRWWAMSLALLSASPLLSTQFILWLIGSTAVAAAVAGRAGRPVRRALPVVVLVVALTHAGFPVQWDALTDGGGQVGAATVATRNLLLVALTGWALVTLRSGRPRTTVNSAGAAAGADLPTPPTSTPPPPAPVPAAPTSWPSRAR
jgi:hypothetical protein